VKVGTGTITRAEYHTAYRQAIAQYVVGRGYTARRKYDDPPKYTWCIRDRRRVAEGVNKALNVAETRQRCRAHIVGRTQWVLQHLIETQWIVQEAKHYGIKTPANPTPDAQTKLQLRVAMRALADHPYHPSQQAIASYYQSHMTDIEMPPQRAALAIVADARDQAVEARRALLRGMPWPTVARRYDFRRELTRLPSAPPNSEDSVNKAIFAAKPGRLVGPLATQEGYYVLKVVRVTERDRPSLDDMREPIRQYLQKVHVSEAGLDYVRRYRERYRAETICVTHLKVPECGNTPDSAFNAQGTNATWVPSPPSKPQIPSTV
jgi:hypothetical protein